MEKSATVPSNLPLARLGVNPILATAPQGGGISGLAQGLPVSMPSGTGISGFTPNVSSGPVSISTLAGTAANPSAPAMTGPNTLSPLAN
jgi:hypothetical protein